MKFKAHDVVKVITEQNTQINKGAVGTVIIAFKEPQEAYEVEFLDGEGKTRAQVTLLPHEIEKNS